MEFTTLTKNQDSQIQEIISRNIIIEMLFKNGFELAMPLRDCGIDLIVYKKTKETEIQKIQLKSSLLESFSFDKKYCGIPDLYLIFVVSLSYSRENITHRIYGMYIEDVMAFISEFKIKSNEDGYYYVKQLSRKMKEYLRKFLFKGCFKKVC